MATRFIDKQSSVTTGNCRNLADAAGICYDTTNSALVYNDAGTLRTVVNTDEAQSLSNKTLVSPTISGSPAASDGVTQFVEVSLTNAEMLALRASPKTLVAAPGAGYYNEFVSATLFFDYTAAYTETADNMAIKYTDGSGTAVSQTIEATGFVDATADTATNALPKIDAIVAKTACENKALVLHNTGDGEYGGGNAANAVRVKVAFRRWTTGW